MSNKDAVIEALVDQVSARVVAAIDKGSTGSGEPEKDECNEVHECDTSMFTCTNAEFDCADTFTCNNDFDG